MDQRTTIGAAQASDAEQISKLVQHTVRVSNAQDYPASVVERVVGNFSAGTVQGLIERRVFLVACRGANIVGTASLDCEVMRTVFVLPEIQGQSVGKQLMHAVESIANQNGPAALRVPASLTANPFYARLGYREVREAFDGEERTIVMEKILRSLSS